MGACLFLAVSGCHKKLKDAAVRITRAVGAIRAHWEPGECPQGDVYEQMIRDTGAAAAC